MIGAKLNLISNLKHGGHKKFETKTNHFSKFGKFDGHGKFGHGGLVHGGHGDVGFNFGGPALGPPIGLGAPAIDLGGLGGLVGLAGGNPLDAITGLIGSLAGSGSLSGSSYDSDYQRESSFDD